MRVRFWGVRGSVPWANAQSIGHGCNTPCIELIADNGDPMVLDAGSGIVGLGDAWRGGPHRVPVLLTHYHWDHLQGLPFFSAFYQAGWSTTVWAPVFESHDRSWMDTIFRSPYFPVPFDRLPAPPSIEHIGIGPSTIGGFNVRALRLNHPGGALAYRIKGAEGDLVYATDHEFGDPAFDEPLAEFVEGAGALISDAHFTREEGLTHKGWGHSSWLEAAEFAAAHKVDRLWLFHHKPGRTDMELMEIQAEARKVFKETDAAGEGDLFEV